MYESLQRILPLVCLERCSLLYIISLFTCPGHLRRIYRFVFGIVALVAFACALFVLVGVLFPSSTLAALFVLVMGLFVLLVVGLFVLHVVALVVITVTCVRVALYDSTKCAQADGSAGLVAPGAIGAALRDDCAMSARRPLDARAFFIR